MAVINANVPPVVLVSLSSIAPGQSCRIGSDYWTRLSETAVAGYLKCAPLGGGAVSNLDASASCEVVQVDSCDVTVSPA